MKGIGNSKKTLIVSMIVFLFCCTTLIGTTFAWFTDSSTSGNNRIQAGNLNISMLYKNETTKEWTAANEGAILSCNNMEPSDIVWAHIGLMNDGKLSLKYKLSLVSKGSIGELADVIDVYLMESRTIPENNPTKDDVTSMKSLGKLKDVLDSADKCWEGVLSPKPESSNYSMATASEGQTNVSTMYATIVLKMQDSVESSYQGKTTGNFDIHVDATQYTGESDSFGDGYDTDALYCDILATPENAQEIINNAAEGTCIGLAAGDYDTLIIQNADGSSKEGIKLVSNSATVDFINLNSSDNITLDGITFDAAGAKQTYFYESNATNYLANITGCIERPDAANKITISDCTFTGNAESPERYVPICFEEAGRSTERASDITISNCVFECQAFNYIRLNYIAKGSVKIIDNVFGSLSLGTSHNTINATDNQADWVISENSFYNWNPEKVAFGSSRNGSHMVTLDIQNNSFINLKSKRVGVLNIKDSYEETNLQLLYANNTANYGAYTFEASPITNGNDNVYYMSGTISSVKNSEELNSALVDAKAGAVICLGEGEYTMTKTKDLAEGITIISSATSGSITVDEGWSGAFKELINGNNLTIVNVTFNNPILVSGSINLIGCTFATEFAGSEGNINMTLEGCTVNGKLHFVNYSTSDIVIKNTTMADAEFSSKGSVMFEGCTITGVLTPHNTSTTLVNCEVGTIDKTNLGSANLTVQ